MIIRWENDLSASRPSPILTRKTPRRMQLDMSLRELGSKNQRGVVAL